MPFIRFSINNPLIINLSLIIIMVMGILSWKSLPQEIFPVVDLDLIKIATEFEGASPLEVEQQVTLPLEEEFEDTQDIDYITSNSLEGFSNIFIKLKPGSNVDDFLREARTILDSIDDLPEIAEEPELSRIRTRFPVITITLFGELSNARLYKLADDVRREMLTVSGVASVGVAGDREWEIWITVDPQQLSALRIPLELVMNAVRSNLVDQPGGSIKSTEGDIRLRGIGAEPDPEDIERIVLRANEEGGQLTLGEVATVTRRFEEPITYARFNGKPSVNLTVTKTAAASTIDVSKQMKQLVDDLRQRVPVDVDISYHTDMSVYVKTRLNTVMSSGLIGLILVLVSLYFLLNFRVAAITAFGIPVSFLFAIILLFYFGFTINMVSLFAFLIVLGMIVDDAIIVTENVYRHMEMGKERYHAAYVGSKEVFWPVVVSTLTTIAAFVPMFAIGSTLGEFIKVIPVVVCCALFGSLLEAFLVLPSHAGHLLKVVKQKQGGLNWKKLLDRYALLLKWSCLNRYFVTVIVIGLLAISLTYSNTRLPFQMFGDVEIGQFYVNIETPNTYSLEDSLELASDIEDKFFEVISDSDIQTLITNVGLTFIDFNRFKFGSNQIQCIVDLKKPVPRGFIENFITPIVSLNFSNFGTRERHAKDIIDDVRNEISKMPGVQRMSILKPDAGPAGSDIEIGIISTDIDLLQSKSDEIKEFLQRLPGTRDIQHDQEPGKLEYKYELNERGKRLGLTQSQLSNVVRSGFIGNEVVHVTWNENRIPVRVIFNEQTRKRSDSLATLPIVLPSGETVFLGDVADIMIDRGLNQIRRRDAQRMAKILGEVDSSVITGIQVTEKVEEAFGGDKQQGYRLLYLGEKKDAEESFAGMFQALIISLAVIFFMLAALFRSLSDPIVIMIAIPFGMIGVIIGHGLFGYNLQFLSVVGVLALSGIIVNDSLILVDFIKRLRAQGEDRFDAVVDAGRVRARPIILTTITTFLGVSPLIFFATGQTAFLAPMAVSLGFGLLFATVLILLVLPCFYLIADDIRYKFFGEYKVNTGPLVHD